jgi:phosphotransferase system HPr (HPr) family protein
MTNKGQMVAEEAIGNVMISAERGLDHLLARRIRELVTAYRCEATLRNRRGTAADTRSILQLLMLDAPSGETLVLHCYGPGAHAAYSTLLDVLAPKGGVS